MSSLLWKYYYEDDLESFQQLLVQAQYNTRPHVARGGNSGAVVGSPGTLGTSPVLNLKSRRAVGASAPNSGGHGVVITKADVNWRDSAGVTLLHHAASSVADNAIGFAAALIEHALIDLYVQDVENGWTACHRAFYFGNVSIARLMLERDAGDAVGRTTGHVHQTIGLIKVKDKEGLGPLDLYAATIKDRTLRPEAASRRRTGSHGSDDERPNFTGEDDEAPDNAKISFMDVNGDQLFTFGSNKNVTLGFGDADDRQFAERINLRRPEHLIRRFYEEYLEEQQRRWSLHDPSISPIGPVSKSGWVEDLPFVVRSRPLIVQDVHMSRLHSAVLTADPEANLYMCGHGQGGRLGAGDEQTRFNFVCIESGALAGKRVATVALGQNHSLALSDEGEIFSWGNNGFGQLGYSLPKAALSDEDPISTIPRQIFGPLKREAVIGIAASRIHSVAHTANSLFSFGKNEGQLGIMDSDARSLEVQVTPRKVAAALFQSAISAVSANDKATVCLLESHDLWVFANYGYAKVPFPLEGFSNYFLKQSFLTTSYDTTPNRIIKTTCGGDTICALSSRGEIYTLLVSQRSENPTSSSTTNPSKIRSAVTTPQRIWSPKKSNMQATDVGVDADGSIILSTQEGSVWKRTKRAQIKDASASGSGDYKPKDYKFSRIPGLSRVLAVRASAFGAYAAVRRDCDVLKTQIVVEDSSLAKDLSPLLSLGLLSTGQLVSEDDTTRHRFWQAPQRPDGLQSLRHTIASSKDVEADLVGLAMRTFEDPSNKHDAIITTSTSDIAIPAHRFILTGRSKVLRRGFRDLCPTSTFTVQDLAVSEIDREGRTVIKFQGLDILTIIDLVLYLYTDSVVDFWHMTRIAPKMAYRYRQVRTELMKVATKLELGKLEPAVRQMVTPKSCLDMDLEIAFSDPAFFYDGDAIIDLEDDSMRVHSAFVCARCPFFEGLFMGRAGGRWLTDRAEDDEVSVDLRHISSKTFKLVLRHLYADTGTELFDEIISIGMEDFLDTVMDVMSAANELMLDRLSQICQAVVGRHVNARNVCGLLNAISPSSVHEFKDAGLEYLCLSLEAVLQGHHLNELDEDLLLELDNIVRENQLACMPFAKSGRADMLLHERHPELAAVLDRNKQAKVDAVTLRSKFHDIDTFRPGSLGDDLDSSPVTQRSPRKSSNMQRVNSDKHALKAKGSSKDMMFAMDEETDTELRTPDQSPAIRPMQSPAVRAMTSARGLEPIASSPPEEVWYDSHGKVLPSPRLAPQTSTSTPGIATPRTPKSPAVGGKTPPNAATPWSLTPLPGPRTEMRDILAQASSSRTSSLSQGLAADRPALPDIPSSFNLGAPKLSQKDRKRMLHSQQSTSPVPQAPSKPAESTPPTRTGNPWQAIGGQRPTGIKDLLNAPKSESTKPAGARASSTPQLTMRQTVANAKAQQAQKAVMGPAGQGALQQRSVSDTKPPADNVPESTRPALRPQPAHQQSTNSKPIPQSIRHVAPVESALGLSMSEIVAQELAAKDEIKAAVAKRDLQDIQAEQEFQEWWDKEAARLQEAEQSSAAAAANKASKRKARGGGRGRGGKGKVEQQAQGSSTASPSG